MAGKEPRAANSKMCLPASYFLSGSANSKERVEGGKREVGPLLFSVVTVQGQSLIWKAPQVRTRPPQGSQHLPMVAYSSCSFEEVTAIGLQTLAQLTPYWKYHSGHKTQCVDSYHLPEIKIKT